MERKTWKEFKEAKLLWWINRILHTFGWAIVFVEEADGSISEVYPARIKSRGFSEETEEAGFIGITNYLKDEINNISDDLDKK